VLKEQRAEYGQQIVSALSSQLTREYGRGFSRQNLFHMMRFVETYPDEQIVSALIRQLSWTHVVQLIYVEDTLKRDFYAEMCRIERWSVRTLRSRMNSMLFERTAISHQPEQVIRQELDALRYLITDMGRGGKERCHTPSP
jgi:hypothetical protein